MLFIDNTCSLARSLTHAHSEFINGALLKSRASMKFIIIHRLCIKIPQNQRSSSR